MSNEKRDGVELRWKRAQAVSGLALAIFATIHLLNVAMAALPGGYDEFQRAVRWIYQQPFLEIVLVVVPIGVHVVAGIRSFLRRRARTSAAPLRTRLHRWAAWYLLAVLGGHVLATRGTELIAGVWPEAAGLAFSIAWIPAFFLPYYALLAVGGLYHLTHGAIVALGVLGVRVDARGARFWAPIGVGSALLLIGLAGLAGWLYAIDDPFANDYAGMWRSLAERWPIPEVPEAR